ncbi:MAG: FkbM family methyltransferase [Candidatus Omnitrophica bacterium]|nr:FkbM family methyltransferase [Candidatus Omnitrophota bacterium]
MGNVYLKKSYKYLIDKLLCKNGRYVYAPFHGIHFPFQTKYISKKDGLKIHANGELAIKESWKKFWVNAFEPGDTVLDIGGYIGLVSIPLAFFGGIVHTFEGSPRNHIRLKEICKPLRQIKIHPVALSNQKKQCTTRFNDCIDGEHPEQEVNYVAYDEYAKENNIPDPKFVKMDIEGMESIALLSMNNLLENIRPVWQLEWHCHFNTQYSDYPGFVSHENGGFDFNKFKALNYTIYNEDFKIVEQFDKPENYFIFPNERLPKNL